MTSTVMQLRKTRTVQSVVIDPHSPGATLIKPLTDAEVTVTQPSTSDIAVAWLLPRRARRRATTSRRAAGVRRGRQARRATTPRRRYRLAAARHALVTCRRFPRPPWPFGHCSTAQPNTTCSNQCTEETHERFDRAGAAGDGTHRGLRMRIERTPSSADERAWAGHGVAAGAQGGAPSAAGWCERMSVMDLKGRRL